MLVGGFVLLVLVMLKKLMMLWLLLLLLVMVFPMLVLVMMLLLLVLVMNFLLLLPTPVSLIMTFVLSANPSVCANGNCWRGKCWPVCLLAQVKNAPSTCQYRRKSGGEGPNLNHISDCGGRVGTKTLQ